MVALPLRRIIVAKPILDWLGRVDRKALAGGSFDMMTVVFFVESSIFRDSKKETQRVFCCCSVDEAGRRRTDGQLL